MCLCVYLVCVCVLLQSSMILQVCHVFIPLQMVAKVTEINPLYFNMSENISQGTTGTAELDSPKYHLAKGKSQNGECHTL